MQQEKRTSCCSFSIHAALAAAAAVVSLIISNSSGFSHLRRLQLRADLIDSRIPSIPWRLDSFPRDAESIPPLLSLLLLLFPLLLQLRSSPFRLSFLFPHLYPRPLCHFHRPPIYAVEGVAGLKAFPDRLAAIEPHSGGGCGLGRWRGIKRV